MIDAIQFQCVGPGLNHVSLAHSCVSSKFLLNYFLDEIFMENPLSLRELNNQVAK